MNLQISSIKGWIKNLLYQQDGKKQILNKGLIKKTSFLFLFLGVMALFFGAETPLPQKKSDFTAQTNSKINSVEIPSHNPKILHKMPEKKSDRLPRKFLGPALIPRPDANEILPGTIVSAKLQTAATDGPVKAIITESVIIDGDEILPVGSVLIGIGQSHDDRVTVQFGKAILNDHGVVSINAVALDQEDQLVGIQASQMDQEMIHLGASIGLNFVGGVAEGLKEKSGQAGVTIEAPTARNALLNGASKAALEKAHSMMEETKNKKYSLKVESGTPILIFFNSNR